MHNQLNKVLNTITLLKKSSVTKSMKVQTELLKFRSLCQQFCANKTFKKHVINPGVHPCTLHILDSSNLSTIFLLRNKQAK